MVPRMNATVPIRGADRAVKILWHYGASPRWQAKVAALEAQGMHVDAAPRTTTPASTNSCPTPRSSGTRSRPITADDLDRAPALRLIQKIGVGVNTIDLEAARSRSIAVCNMPGTNAPAVAEMTLLLMLACLRQAPDARSARPALKDAAGRSTRRCSTPSASSAGAPSGSWGSGVFRAR